MKKQIRKAVSGQICEIVRQMGSGEIDFDRAQRIITNRTPKEAAEAASLRERQARVLFDKKLADVLGCSTFEQYLDAEGKDSLEPVPQIPVFPKEQVRLFGTQGITLVDGRVLEKVGLIEYCKLVGLAYGGDDQTFKPYDVKRAKSGIRWMIAQDGFRNRNREPRDCRKTFASFEVGADVTEGIAFWLQDPSLTQGHFMDLPGSVCRGARESVARLGFDDDRPGLYWLWYGYADPDCGSVSRGE